MMKITVRSQLFNLKNKKANNLSGDVVMGILQIFEIDAKSLS